MLHTDNQKLYSFWVKFHIAVVFAFFLYFSFYQFAQPYLAPLYPVIYKGLALVLIACWIAFRGFRDSMEFKMVFAYCLWLSFIRILDGSIVVSGQIDALVNRWMIMPYLGFAMLMSEKTRFRLLDILSIIVCAGYTILGLICLWAVLNQITIINPISGTELVQIVGGRIFVFWKSCNTVGHWFYLVFALLTYLFFRFKKGWQRALLVIEGLVCYLTISITFSRSTMVSFSIFAAMMVLAVVLRHMIGRSRAKKALVTVAVVCLCLPLIYKSFDLSGQLVVKASEVYLTAQADAVKQPENTAELQQTAYMITDNQNSTPQPTILSGGSFAEAQELSESDIADSQIDSLEQSKESMEMLQDRGMDGSGRIELWTAAIKAAAEEPLSFLTGRINALTYTNNYVKEHMPEQDKMFGERAHHHNVYLELLLEGGIPGFLLIMAFIVLLVIKMVKLFFSEAEEVTLAVKALICLVSGFLVTNLFESALFWLYDMRTVIFCVAASYVLAAEKDLHDKLSA